MHNLKLIVVREYLARVRNKTFMIMTFLSPVIMVGMVLLIAYLTSLNNEESRIVTIHDPAKLVIQDLRATDHTSFVDYSHLSLTQAKDSTEKNDYYGLLVVPDSNDSKFLAKHIQFLANESPSNSFLSGLEQKIATTLTNRELQNDGVNLAKLNQAKADVFLKVENFSGQETSKMTNYIKMFFGGAAGYLLMMFIIIYGNMVMRSVIEEKTNRIIEIIISSVKPFHLMMGKILGTSLAGITQFLIWIIFGGILLFAVSSFIGIPFSPFHDLSPEMIQQSSASDFQKIISDVNNLPLLELVICFLIYFLGGYFLYSAIYAAIGAAVDSETDTQQFMFPVILPLMLGIYVGLFSVIENPDGIVATTFSFIPLTSPIVMLMRIPFGVPWWQVAVSIAILIASIFGVIWIASKIYRVGILMYGKKPTYKELYRWLKY